MKNLYMLLLFYTQLALAQSDSAKVVQYPELHETMLFEDNFSNPLPDGFPSKWEPVQVRQSFHHSHRFCHIYRDTGGYFMSVKSDEGNVPLTIDNMLTPKMNDTNYLPDHFLLKYDFLPGSDKASEDIQFRDDTGGWIAGLSIIKATEKPMLFIIKKNGLTETPIPFHIEYTAWHHITLSCSNGKMIFYLDNKSIPADPDLGALPRSFSLTSAGKDSVCYKNVTLATAGAVKPAFNDLMTKNKFVTHAIHFGTDKWNIATESIPFIKELANWLQTNQAVKLEIDGHTDNDGSDAHNLQLSQQRADAVKTMLVSLGINKARLTTKGYGASKPLKPNTTPEGKAANRRVEFIRK